MKKAYIKPIVEIDQFVSDAVMQSTSVVGLHLDTEVNQDDVQLSHGSSTLWDDDAQDEW